MIGAVADDLFKAIVDQHPKKDAFKHRGVLLVVSESPALIQVRVGEDDLYSLARWGGVREPHRRSVCLEDSPGDAEDFVKQKGLRTCPDDFILTL